MSCEPSPEYKQASQQLNELITKLDQAPMPEKEAIKQQIASVQVVVNKYVAPQGR